MKTENEKKEDYLPPKAECIDFELEGVIAASVAIRSWGDNAGDASDSDDWNDNGD
jgi:hypothetical protein